MKIDEEIIARQFYLDERPSASDIMSLFRSCFSPRKAARDSATKEQAAFNKNILEDRWKQYDNLSKESTWGQVPLCTAPHRKATGALKMLPGGLSSCKPCYKQLSAHDEKC